MGGGQPWGGATIPPELVTTFSAYAGLNAYSGGDFTGNAIVATYNLKEEMERLWYSERECAANGEFEDDDGLGNVDKWFADGDPIAPPPDGTHKWYWMDGLGGKCLAHMGAETEEAYQTEGDQVIQIEDGRIYRVSFMIWGYMTGNVRVRLGDGSGGLGAAHSGNGRFVEQITADLIDDLRIALVPTSDFYGFITDILVTLVTDSPYGLCILHDPNPDVDAADGRYTTFDSTITAMDPTMDWHDDAAAAETAVDDHISWIADINTAVATYESGKLPELQRSQARFLAQLADVGAIHSTAAFKGLAIMEGEFNRDSGNFRAQAMLVGYQERAKAILQGVSDAQVARRFKIEAGRLSTLVKAELAKLNIMANTDYIKQQLMLAVESELWNVNLLDRVKSVNMISGAPVLQRGLESWQGWTSLAFSVLGGAMNIIPGLIGK